MRRIRGKTERMRPMALVALWVGLAASCLVLAGVGGSASAAQGRPNIIFVFTDDQDAGSLDKMKSVREDLMLKGKTFSNAASSGANRTMRVLPYGQGDGSLTFDKPDMRGRVALGAGTGDAADATLHRVGQKKGTEAHLLTGLQSGVKPHPHGTVTPNAPQNDMQPGVAGVVRGRSAAANTDQAVAQNVDEPHNNTQPATVGNWFVKMG
jgi:hypothetical protein